MRYSRCTFILVGALLAIPGICFARPKTTASTKRHAALKHTSETRHRKSLHSTAHHEYATVEMPAERATLIQTALIKQGYLTGEPTGIWDTPTVAAMQKMQSENGWQTKITPDSRALIKLGLGPQPATASAGADISAAQPQMQSHAFAQTHQP